MSNVTAEPLPMESIDQQEWELVKLLRKPSWIGMEQEAEVVARALVGRPATSSLVPGPRVPIFAASSDNAAGSTAKDET